MNSRNYLFHSIFALLALSLLLIMTGCGQGEPEPPILPTNPVVTEEAPTVPTPTAEQQPINETGAQPTSETAVNNEGQAPQPTVSNPPSKNKISSPPVITDTGCTYTVKAGDTMFEIAQAHGTTVDQIATLNGMADPSQILVGQELFMDCGLHGDPPPPPANTFTTNITGIDLNGRGNNLVTTPGTLIESMVTFDIWSQDDCPGCIDQIVIAINDEPQACAYDGIPGVNPGLSGSGAFQLTAPTQPGTYQVSYASTQQYTCADAIATYHNGHMGEVIATIIVQEEAPTSELTTYVSDVDLNGQGSYVVVEPGASVDGSLFFEIWNQEDCPTCIDQIVVTVGNEPQTCAYNGIPGVEPGETGYGTFQFSAPVEPGVYEVSFGTTQQYSCTDALANYHTATTGYPIATLEVAAEEVVINGWNASEVYYDGGVFTQINTTEWVETNGDGTHTFTELGRDEWSIYLQATDRDSIYVQLDLWTSEVKYEGPVQSGQFVLYTISSAAAGRVNGWTAATVSYGSGIFQQTSGSEWVETNNDGPHYFVETHRDEWSVYLTATDRENVQVQLDLWTLQVNYADADTNGYVYLYTVTSAEPARIDGWNAAFVNYGNGSFEQISATEWVENNSDGAHYFVETGRDEWSVYLQATDRTDVYVQLDLWTMEVKYEGPVQSEQIVLYLITGAQ